MEEWVLTSKILQREIWTCDLLLFYVPLNRDCEIASLPCLCTAVLYAMQLSALWKLHINSVPLFNWLKCFSALTVGFFYKLHNLKNNEMSLFRIHGSGKRTAQQRRFNWIGCILHVLHDVFMLEGLWVSFMVDDQIGVYFPSISHCYVWCHFTCVIWEMYQFCSLYLQACMFYILVYIFLKVNGKNNPHAWSTVLFWWNEYIEWRIATCFSHIIIQTRFQKSWDTVQIVNKKGMQ